MPSLDGCCMYMGLAHHVLGRMSLHWGGTLTTCNSPHQWGHWRGWSMWQVTSTVNGLVAMQIMPSTDETFLPCGSPYRSSRWIGRSTSGLMTLHIMINVWISDCISTFHSTGTELTGWRRHTRGVIVHIDPCTQQKRDIVYMDSWKHS